MKTLNLVYPEKSDIEYRIDKFPDGQQQVIILNWSEQDDEFSEYNLLQNSKVQIKSRLNNFQDLELIICATKSLRKLEVKEINLYTPYFLGSRSDRQFEEGSNNYLKDVICPIINSLKFDSVTVLDPHSDVLEGCLNNFKPIKQHQSFMSIGSMTLLEKALSLIYFNNDYSDIKIKDKLNDFILVSPDAGATKKIYKLAEKIGYKENIITCSKDRDIDGRLTKTVVPELPTNKDIIIIYDICDGGATFINIVKEIKGDFPELYENQPKIYLIVTHSIFSKGFEELSKYFDGIYCTNSYRDIRLNQSINDILGADPKFLKQLNVF